MKKDRTLRIFWILFFACLLMAFSLTGISYGTMKSETLTRDRQGNDGSTGKTILLAEAKKRMIPLAPSSAKIVMAPPCTVLAVKGKEVTLRDFNNRVGTIEVTNPAGIQVGDRGVVKNGQLILGIVPE